MKKLLLTLVFGAAGLTMFGQNEYIAYPATGKGVASTFVTDYHCLGINPANLGWKMYDDKSITMGSSEFGVSIYSESLAKQELRDNIWAVMVDRSLDTLSYEQKVEAAQGFASDFAFNWDYNMFGFAYQNEKFGGIAFSIRSRAVWNSSFDEQFSGLLFQGQFSNYFDSLSYYDGSDTVNIGNYQNMSPDSAANVLGGMASSPMKISEILGDSYMRLSLNREYHIGYGRKLFGFDSTLIVYAGAGAKYIQGIAMFDLGTDENGNLRMVSAMSPGFDIDYGMAALNNPSAMAETGEQFFKSSVGQGWGFDFGAHVLLFKKLHLAASVTNIGSMTYTGNVYEIEDTLLVSYNREGLESMDVTEFVPEMVEGSGLVKMRGVQEVKINLPGTLRFGASLELGRFAHVGGELIAPFNEVPGSLNGFAWGLGGDVRLAGGKVNLMAGMTGGGSYDFQIPLGVNFVLGGGAYEVGIASRDALTFFVNNEPTISAAFGFARVRF